MPLSDPKTWNRNTIYILLGYITLITIITETIIDSKEKIFSSVGSFLKYALIYAVVLIAIREIIKAIRRVRGNFGHEYDDTDLKDSG
ncbi:MAG TPA: hypothetical protein VNX68_09440 [Nitrosopumilaceae archaeon]|jgi:hypothetical protein|nr:hypothetical protein [Nitrosopumilaceae archaeon]